jgi:hypothetical protein
MCGKDTQIRKSLAISRLHTESADTVYDQSPVLVIGQGRMNFSDVRRIACKHGNANRRL